MLESAYLNLVWSFGLNRFRPNTIQRGIYTKIHAKYFTYISKEFVSYVESKYDLNITYDMFCVCMYYHVI